MTTNNVNEIVDNVSQALDTANSDSEQVTALERFQKEVEEDMQGMTPEQVKEYMPQLTKQLEEKNQLPVLALAFADQLGGDLNASDLRSEVRSANRAIRDGDSSRQLDKVFLNYLAENYDKGANLIETKNDSWLRDDANVSQADITAKLAEFREARDERNRVEANKANAGDVAAQLLAGGDKSLFNFIDRDSENGKITEDELKKYLSDAESSGSEDGQFALEKQDLVQSLVDNWDDKDKGLWLRGGSHGAINYAFSKTELLLAAGKSSEDQLFADRAAQDNADEKRTSDVEVTAKEDEDQPSEGDVSASEDEDQVADALVDSKTESADQLDAADTNIEAEPEPIIYEVRKGDSYWRIANALLCENASPRDILQKMNELQEYNDNENLMWYPNNPQRIKIPPMKAQSAPATQPSQPSRSQAMLA